MKEKNMKFKMFFIAILFIIVSLMLCSNSYALELNEEYVKEDFKENQVNLSETTFTDKGL